MSGFYDIFERLKRRLMRRGASHADAEDFIQEAFARLTVEQGRQEIRSPEAFLFRTASNLATDESRRRERRRIIDQPIEDLALTDLSPAPDELLQRRQRLVRLMEGLRAMDPKTRSMLIAQRLDGRSLSDIAHANDVSISAVEKRIARGLLFLMRWTEGWA